MIRSYARAFHCNIGDVYSWKFYRFIDEYIDSVDQLNEENAEQERIAKRAKMQARSRRR